MFTRQSNQTHRPRLTVPELILASVFGLLLILATTYAIFLGLSLICGVVVAVFADGMTGGKVVALLAISAVAACCVALPVLIFAVRRFGRRIHFPVYQQQFVERTVNGG